MRKLTIGLFPMYFVLSLLFAGVAWADRSNATLTVGITEGATHPENGTFSNVDDQPVFFQDGGAFYFIKSSPTDSHGANTRYKGTSMDDLVFDSVVTIHDVNNVWLGGAGWVDPDTGSWYAVGVQEYKYDSFNSPKKTSGGGKTYFHRLYAFTSTDKGLNWYSQGEIVSDAHPYDWDWYDRWQNQDWGPGPHTLFADTRSGYFYLYYPDGWRDWSKDNRYVYDAVARCPISAKMAPGCWQKWYNGAWTEPGLGGKQSSVIANGLNMQLAWDTYINKYIAIGPWESEVGLAGSDRHLWVATATDLATQNWSAPVFLNQQGNGWYYWISDSTGTATNNLGQHIRFYYGQQNIYQDITLDASGTYTNYTTTQRLPEFVVPEPAWNGLTGRSDRTEGEAASDNGASNPAGQTPDQAFDNDVATKWYVYSNTGDLAYTFPNGNSYAVNRYTVTSANDSPTRDPKSWTLQASNDGINWIAIDTQTGITFSDRKQTKEFNPANSTLYKNYRLHITANNGDANLQLAELQLFAGGAPFDTAGSPSPIGKQIWLKASTNNKYVSAWSDSNTPLETRAAAVSTWEKFNVVDAGGGYIALQAYTGKYVTVSSGANNPLQATATAIGASEKFQLVDTSGGLETAGGYVALKAAANGNYVTVSSDPNNPLQATGTAIGTSQQFLTYWSRNLALNKGTASSATANGEVPANMVDGSATTKASTPASAGNNAWLYVDLGVVTPISDVNLDWGAQAYGKDYNIQTSTDGVNWTTVYSVTGNTSGGYKDHPLNGSVAARYVKMQGVTRGSTIYGYTILEFEVYGASNIALHKTVTASSTDSGNVPANCTDGDTPSKCSTTAADGDDGWFYVDLGAVTPISDVKLDWGAQAYGVNYNIQSSNDGVNWTTVYPVTGNASGGYADHPLPAGTSARYVKMQGVTRATTTYGYTILEFEIY